MWPTRWAVRASCSKPSRVKGVTHFEVWIIHAVRLSPSLEGPMSGNSYQSLRVHTSLDHTLFGWLVDVDSLLTGSDLCRVISMLCVVFGVVLQDAHAEWLWSWWYKFCPVHWDSGIVCSLFGSICLCFILQFVYPWHLVSDCLTLQEDDPSLP